MRDVVENGNAEYFTGNSARLCIATVVYSNLEIDWKISVGKNNKNVWLKPLINQAHCPFRGWITWSVASTTTGSHNWIKLQCISTRLHQRSYAFSQIIVVINEVVISSAKCFKGLTTCNRLTIYGHPAYDTIIITTMEYQNMLKPFIALQFFTKS